MSGARGCPPTLPWGCPLLRLLVCLSGFLDRIPTWGCSPTQSATQFLDASWVSENSVLILSAQRQCQSPQLRNQSCKTAPGPTSDASHKPQAVTRDPDGPEAPTLTSRSFTLLEPLTELRETLPYGDRCVEGCDRGHESTVSQRSVHTCGAWWHVGEFWSPVWRTSEKRKRTRNLSSWALMYSHD